MTDDLTLIIGGRRLSGWTSIRVTRGIERCPNDFEIEMTELYPDEVSTFVIQPGDACIVLLGNDVVITGYVDRFMPMIAANNHAIKVSGRGKCADLVDCAAEWPGGQISGATVLEIAKKLAKPYGQPNYAIDVTADVDTGIRIPQFNLILGETAFDIIERLCRYDALLAYEKADGNLFLTRVGIKEAASGFVQGKNVQSAYASYTIDQRYSEVMAFIQSVDTFLELGEAGNLIATEKDPNVKRHRRRIVIAESGDSDFTVIKKRAQWEIARRFGRSQQLHVVVDSWRDAAGALWEPNTLAPISLQSLKLPDAKWVIAEVSYRRDTSGTTAELTLMPREAFLPQPLLLFPVFADVLPQAAK